MISRTETKIAASVADVARMVGLSRARFYQLQREGVFPVPCYDVRTRRPVYTEEQQRECLDVRRRNCGMNGRAILFYARRLDAVTTTPPARPHGRPRPVITSGGAARHTETLEYLSGLGLGWATADDVDAALRAEYPAGTAGVEQGTVLGRLFVHLHRKGSRRNSADNVR